MASYVAPAVAGGRWSGLSKHLSVRIAGSRGIVLFRSLAFQSRASASAATPLKRPREARRCDICVAGIGGPTMPNGGQAVALSGAPQNRNQFP